jgi:serine/threonine protein kinase/Tol biopolymer transport system component
MPLNIGTQLGSHEITALLGKGGMGEVYRARDTKLKREVAIKILPEEFARDSDRVSRFQREAEVLASLNHPNIAGIHDLAEANGSRYLVLELVEGETLADRIARGPMPIEEALPIAIQICEALEAAHERGIIHRDLKPANVKITPDGKVKVLDFGLAKAMENEPANTMLSNSPTMLSGTSGMILGTAAYMSPEQAKGRQVDKRTDIFAFGCVLYEMLTGKPTFDGEDASQIYAHVLAREPDWNRLPTAVPSRVRELLRLCLEKNVKNRRSDATDVRLDIELALKQPVQVAPLQPATRRRERLWISLTAMLLIGIAALSAVHFREKPAAPPELVRFQIYPPDKHSFATNLIALSPDGRKLAFTATDAEGHTQLWVRALDSLDPRLLPGTEGAADPFWAADSRWLAFQSQGRLKKIDTTGGPPQTLCDLAGAGYIAGDWNRDGVILFASGAAGLMRVSSTGGMAQAATTIDRSANELYHRKPVFLPDGKHYLYVRVSSVPENSAVYLGSLDARPEDPKSKSILAANAFIAYAPDPADPRRGQVLFLREGTLMAQPFDVSRLETAGEAVPVVEQIATYGNVGAIFSASASGALAYRAGGNIGASRLTWYDRQGKVLGYVGAPGEYNEIALSPDGTQVVETRTTSQTAGLVVWIDDLARGTPTRLTFKTRARNSVWSPDGRRIVFSTVPDLYTKAANGAGEEEPLLHSPENKSSQDWSTDGKYLMYSTAAATALWVLPMNGDGKPFPYLQSKANVGQARFSPDGRWVVYTSNESFTQEVYVRPFPADANGGGRWLVSSGGGYQPRWRRDGKEILYFNDENRLMSVDFATTPTFKPGLPKPLFVAPIRGGAEATTSIARWDIAPDGQRFLINTTNEDRLSQPITVLLNWTSAFRK